MAPRNNQLVEKAASRPGRACRADISGRSRRPLTASTIGAASAAANPGHTGDLQWRSQPSTHEYHPAGWPVTLCDTIWHVSSRSKLLYASLPLYRLSCVTDVCVTCVVGRVVCLGCIKENVYVMFYVYFCRIIGPILWGYSGPLCHACRCCCCCGHRFYIAIYQVSLLSHAACAIAIAGVGSSW